MDARYAVVESRATDRQRSHIEIRAVHSTTKLHEFLATEFELRIVVLEVGLHHVFVEMVMTCRYRRVRGKNSIDRHIFV